MARHRKHRRHRKHGFGSIISVRKGLDGLLDTGTVVGDVLPVLLGAGLAFGTAALIRKMAPVGTASGTGAFLSKWATLVGSATGALAGLGLVYVAGKRTAGTVTMASAVAFGGLCFVGEKMHGSLAGLGAIVPQYQENSGMFGLGAVAPQIGPGMNGLGATVMEDWSKQRPDSIGDAYGAAIQLSGLGAVNTGAFGTPGFSN